MIDERLKRYSNIGDKNGLYYIYRCISNGTNKCSSLKKLVILHRGYIDVDVSAALLYYNQIGLISYDIDEDVIIFNGKSNLGENDFYIYLSETSVKLILYENIIDLDTISYDINEDAYYAPTYCIKMKYACIRNLLFSLNVFTYRTSSTCFISQLLLDMSRSKLKEQKKLSQKELLEQLETDRIIGEEGEKFVLQYEKNRLKRRGNTNDIKQISLYDVRAGYDIISYNDVNSNQLDRLIEVKTYKGNPHFHWSSNEMDIAKLRKDHYFIYLVSFEDMNKEGYAPIIIQDPINSIIDNGKWEMCIDSISMNMK